MSYFILYPETYNRFYIGQTNDIESRLFRHNSGTERATQPYRPWMIKWFAEKSNRAEAMQLEKKLKNLSGERLINFINKYS